MVEEKEEETGESGAVRRHDCGPGIEAVGVGNFVYRHGL